MRSSSASIAAWRVAGAWALYAALLAGAPMLWQGSFALTLLSQAGIAIVVCLSYNLLLGEGGMLSFGHAVYSGAGAYLAIHALAAAGAGTLACPVVLVPLLGGLGGWACAALLGWVSTRTAGMPFAMITLGIGELVAALALMLPEYFGGEGGIGANRVVAAPASALPFGLSLGPQIELYGLIAAYCFACTAALYGFTRTPLGRLLNAVRDNPERVEFIGLRARHVRHLAFMTAGFFAGVGGGLSALQFEIVTPEVFGAHRSAMVLLFVVLGGSGFFVGPILGAALMVFSLVLLSEWTPAWALHVGLAFLAVVIGAPGGLVSLLPGQARHHGSPATRPPGTRLGVIAGWTSMAVGAALAVEMLYRLRQIEMLGPRLHILGASVDVSAADGWIVATLLCGCGAGLLFFARREARGASA